jgi:hypothetical protein
MTDPRDIDRARIPSPPGAPFFPSRIALICGGLAEGRNGVGDYCRYLAVAVTAQSVACDLIALNDPDTKSVVEAALPSGQGSINLLRIPSTLPREERARIAGAALARWKPDCVSLQFVSTGFSSRGIVRGEERCLEDLLRPYPLHVMMHELWIGYRLIDSVKYFLLGRVQRFYLLRLLSRLHPKLIHTSNAIYQRMLRDSGIEAGILPLFSSVPIVDDKADWLDPLLRAACRDGAEVGESRWIFGFFGGISPSWGEESLFARLSDLGRRHRRRIVIMSIGNAGAHSAAMIARWQEKYPSIVFIGLGYRSAREISQFLNTIDVGLTSYPLYVLGKSSAAATMLAHGLPVIASWGDLAPELAPVSDEYRDLVWKDDDFLEQHLLSPPSRRQRVDTPSRIAHQLLDELRRAITRP